MRISEMNPSASVIAGIIAIRDLIAWTTAASHNQITALLPMCSSPMA